MVECSDRFTVPKGPGGGGVVELYLHGVRKESSEEAALEAGWGVLPGVLDALYAGDRPPIA